MLGYGSVSLRKWYWVRDYSCWLMSAVVWVNGVRHWCCMLDADEQVWAGLET